ncbi:MAG: hypothetical protein M0019_00770 [Actinomycetota bacterium]|nr:hypothetical protein [Actinomycetota bacterium]
MSKFIGRLASAPDIQLYWLKLHLDLLKSNQQNSMPLHNYRNS